MTTRAPAVLKRCLIECLTAVDDEAWPLLLSISASLILVEPSRQDSSLSLQNWQNILRERMTSLILFCIFWFSLIYDNLIFAFSSWMVWQISSVVSFHSDLGICNRGRKTFLRKFLLSFSLWDTAAAAAWFFVVNLLKEAATSSAWRTIEHSHFKRKQVGLLWIFK